MLFLILNISIPVAIFLPRKKGSVYFKSIFDFLVEIPSARESSLPSPNKFDSLIPIFANAPSSEEKPAPTENSPVEASSISMSILVLLDLGRGS